MENTTEIATIDTQQYVPSLLNVLNNRLTSGASTLYLRNYGVGINEWRIMVVLARTPDISAKTICQQSAIHLTVISRSLRDMEAKGFVEIQKSKWERAIRLTPLGIETYNLILKTARQREKLLLTGFDDAEKSQLCEYLRRMVANIALVDEFKPE
jgi:DNA-binding MarR family transcriptional regulator